jgi:hypothetical protein
VVEETLQHPTHAARILLGILARIDVFDNRHEVPWRTVVIADQGNAQIDPDTTTILAKVALFQGIAVDFPAQQPRELFQIQCSRSSSWVISWKLRVRSSVCE